MSQPIGWQRPAASVGELLAWTPTPTKRSPICHGLYRRGRLDGYRDGFEGGRALSAGVDIDRTPTD